MVKEAVEELAGCLWAALQVKQDKDNRNDERGEERSNERADTDYGNLGLP